MGSRAQVTRARCWCLAVTAGLVMSVFGGGLPGVGQVVLAASTVAPKPPAPNHVDPTARSKSVKPAAVKVAKPATTAPATPQIIGHPTDVPMQPGTLALSATQPAVFTGSD